MANIPGDDGMGFAKWKSQRKTDIRCRKMQNYMEHERLYRKRISVIKCPKTAGGHLRRPIGI